MPRFAISSLASSSPRPVASPAPVGSPPFSSPGLGSTTASVLERIGLPPRNGPSVRLCCSSGDSGAIFSLNSNGSSGDFVLERRPLPLYDESNQPSAPQKSRLPARVQTAFDLSPPIELLCVESADKPKTKKMPSEEKSTFIPPCLLCVYSRKDVFYLEMKLDSQGEVIVEAKTVFDNYFVYAGDETTIVRIRPAPQSRMDFATLCSRGAMAMLTHNPHSSEYRLVLRHNDENDLVSVPLSFQFEESYEMGESITDFCFAQSGESNNGGLSLLSTLAVLLMKGSGELYAASPILFDGSVVPKSGLTHALDLLDYHIEVWPKETPQGRRAKAARKYLKDAFGDIDGQNKFLTAKAFANGVGYSALSWPVALQGPILNLQSNMNFTSFAVSIENFSASDMIGVAIALEYHAVDICVISPSSLIPRFCLESVHDRYALDDALANAGVCVQILALGEEEPTGARTAFESVSLVRDRMLDSMLHYVTPTGVTTIHTTAPRIALHNIEGASPIIDNGSSEACNDATPRTSVWSSVKATSTRVQGAVIGDDPRFGHALFVSLSNGALVVENLSESRCLHEMEHLIKLTAEDPASSQANTDDFGPPLYEVVQPMLQKISAGLASMGKFVGSQTPSKQVSPEILAVALSVKERCNSDVVLPLLELKQTVRARRQVIKVMLMAQLKELSAQKKILQVLQDRMGEINEKARTAQTNAHELAKRSNAVMQASQDLMPSLTQAEYDYFQQLKRLKVQKTNLEQAYREMSGHITNLRENGRQGCKINLEDAMKDHFQNLLDGQEKMMFNIEAKLKANEVQTQVMSREVGLPS